MEESPIIENEVFEETYVPSPEKLLPLHVVIDTSAWQHDFGFRSDHFRVLEELASEGLLCIYLPSVVDKEVQSHICELVNSETATIRRSLATLEKLGLVPSQIDGLSGILQKNFENIAEEGLAVFNRRLKRMKCDVMEIDPFAAARTVKNYFEGTPPFRKLRCKDDFPDGFIFEEIRDLSEKHRSLHVIAADNRLREACESLSSVETYSNVKNFIHSETCAPLIIENEVRQNVARVCNLLKHFKFNALDLEAWAAENLEEHWLPIDGLPSDEDEGWVFATGDPFDVDFDRTSPTYIGNGIFSIPIEFKVTAIVSYAIFYADFDLLPEKHAVSLGICDRNKYFLDVEENVELLVVGAISLKVDFEGLKQNPIPDEELIELMDAGNCEIESDFEIELFDYPIALR